MAITLDTIITRSDTILATQLENEVVMMDIDAGAYYGLEEPASRIWELVETPMTVSEICNHLTREFAVELAQCQQEVIAFLSDLENQKIISPTPV